MSLWLNEDGLEHPADLIAKPSALGIANLNNQQVVPFTSIKDAQVLVNDGSNNRVVIGRRADGTYGLKVSKVGTDALTGTNDQMIMNSDFNQFKIIGSGTGTLAATVSQGTANTLIDLGPYVSPYIIHAYLTGGNGITPLPYLIANAGIAAGGPGVAVSTYATHQAFQTTSSTNSFYGVNIPIGNYTLQVQQTSGNGYTNTASTFKYYILQETAS